MCKGSALCSPEEDGGAEHTVGIQILSPLQRILIPAAACKAAQLYHILNLRNDAFSACSLCLVASHQAELHASMERKGLGPQFSMQHSE